MKSDLLPSTRHAKVAQAELSLRLGQPSEALNTIARILADDPDHVGALEVLARAQWQLDQAQPLLDTLTKLIRMNPYEPGYHMLRGAALKNLGRFGESLRAYVRAGDAPGAKEMISEVSAIQSALVLQLLREDIVFKAQYSQNPEKACTTEGFEFGSESKIRHHALMNEFSASRLLIRPS